MKRASNTHEVILSTPVRGITPSSDERAPGATSSGKAGDTAFSLYCQQNLSPINGMTFKSAHLKTPDQASKQAVPAASSSSRSSFKPTKTSLLSPYATQHTSGLSKFYLPQTATTAVAAEAAAVTKSTATTVEQHLSKSTMINPPDTELACSTDKPAVESNFTGALGSQQVDQQTASSHALATLKAGCASVQSDKFYVFSSPVFKIKFGARSQFESFLDSSSGVDLQKDMIDDFNYLGCRSRSVFANKNNNASILSQEKQLHPHLHFRNNNPNNSSGYKRVIEFDEEDTENQQQLPQQTSVSVLNSDVKQPQQTNGICQDAIENSSNHIQNEVQQLIFTETDKSSMGYPHFYGYPSAFYNSLNPYAFMPAPLTAATAAAAAAVNGFVRPEEAIATAKKDVILSTEEKERTCLTSTATTATAGTSTTVTAAKQPTKKSQSSQLSQKRKLFDSPESIQMPSPTKKSKKQTQVTAAEKKHASSIKKTDPTLSAIQASATAKDSIVDESIEADPQIQSSQPPLLPPHHTSCAAEKKICCNCKRTKCLKLYCECFAASRVCEGCSCQGCFNKPEFEAMRIEARAAILDRNISAFDSKIDNQGKVQQLCGEQGADKEEKVHSKGCNCKKSNCLKKYCECFQLGVKCTKLCKCENCKNIVAGGGCGGGSGSGTHAASSVLKANPEEVVYGDDVTPLKSKENVIVAEEAIEQQYPYNYYCDEGYYSYYYQNYEAYQQYYGDYYAQYGEHPIDLNGPVAIGGQHEQIHHEFMTGEMQQDQLFAFEQPSVSDKTMDIEKNNQKEPEKIDEEVEKKEVELTAALEPTEKVEQPVVQAQTAAQAETAAVETSIISQQGLKTISSKKTKKSQVKLSGGGGTAVGEQSLPSSAQSNRSTRLIQNETKKKNAVILNKNQPVQKLDFHQETEEGELQLKESSGALLELKELETKDNLDDLLLVVPQEPANVSSKDSHRTLEEQKSLKLEEPQPIVSLLQEEEEPSSTINRSSTRKNVKLNAKNASGTKNTTKDATQVQSAPRHSTRSTASKRAQSKKQQQHQTEAGVAHIAEEMP